MAAVLLETKLHIPRLRSKLVARSRLLQRLTEGLRGKLTFVSAPAGFGKTRLIHFCPTNDPYPEYSSRLGRVTPAGTTLRHHEPLFGQGGVSL